ncbi:histidine phosphatase family protein [Fibrobacter sp. UWH4]|uniref:histidine phosphatase family protein n=1 Tax=Fibrobacter sp. UWH4 TaxID=1896210 RepID=UPI00093409EB|nr:histidine phosphatase family protein [Fibrobacter sp. UWH4]
MNMNFIPASTFFTSLTPDERVFLLIRHGERRHITPEDPDFGAHVGLTERGRKQALALGKCIPAEGDMSFFSSPVGRCIETAQNIGKGRGIENPHIEKLDCLAEYFVQDYDEYTKVLRAGFYEGICEWMQNEAAGKPRGDKEAFAPLAARSEDMLAMMFEKGNCRFNIFATHDAWVVPCLTHFCEMQFSPKRWMNFLTGMAVAATPRGKRIVPITALDSGWLEF